jgi:hypothetical protein
MRLIPLVLLLAGCAATDPQAVTRDQEALSRELAGREAGPPETCIPAGSGGSSLVVVDARTLTYEQGRTLWVNRLEAECPGLRPLDTLVLEVHGSQYCRNDRFRTIAAGSTIPGPNCLLGNFTPYRRR